MAEYIALAQQEIAPNESVVFEITAVPCERGFVRHRDGTGSFLLSGYVPYNSCGCRNSSALYLVDFGANIAIPTGGTVEEISLALSLDGATIPTSTMRVTPAAVEEFFNVSKAINVQVWRGCCETLTVTNTSDQSILVSEANIIFARPDMTITR